MAYEQMYKKEIARSDRLIKQLAVKDKIIVGLAKDFVTQADNFREDIKQLHGALMIGGLIDEVYLLKKVMLEASDYLDTNKHTSIGNQSILHKKFKELAL